MTGERGSRAELVLRQKTNKQTKAKYINKYVPTIKSAGYGFSLFHFLMQFLGAIS